MRSRGRPQPWTSVRRQHDARRVDGQSPALGGLSVLRRGELGRSWDRDVPVIVLGEARSSGPIDRKDASEGATAAISDTGR
jgi:hypothetical protein